MSRNYWTLGKKGMKTRLSKAQAAYENALENVENLHVKISEGNNKLGAIPSVSLIPVMDCGNCAQSVPRAATTCETTLSTRR